MSYTRYDLPGLPYVCFGGSDNHCYRKYGLILRNFTVSPPQRITTVIRTPLGRVDITDNIDTNPHYDLRTIKASFTIPEGKYEEIYEYFSSDVNGVYFEDIYYSEYGRHYSGRVQIDSFTSNRLLGTIGITILADPVSFAIEKEEIALSYDNEPVDITFDANKYQKGDKVYMYASSTRVVINTSSTDLGEQEVTIRYGSAGKNYLGVITGNTFTATVKTGLSTTATYNRTLYVEYRREMIA